MYSWAQFWKNRTSRYYENCEDGDNNARWVCVAWVFDFSDAFAKATRRIITYGPYGCGGKLAGSNLELPIPESLIDQKIEECGQDLINKVIRIITTIVYGCQGLHPAQGFLYGYDIENLPRPRMEIYHGGNRSTSYNGMTIGSLIESLSKESLFPGSPIWDSESKFYEVIKKMHCLKNEDGYFSFKDLKRQFRSIEEGRYGLDLGTVRGSLRSGL
ncbi:hypothetical protein NHQ30_006284 [Ciborinia camelliae]|nr:hypothetical protein NHQ30_006284 [Ciborinia camelliae]